MKTNRKIIFLFLVLFFFLVERLFFCEDKSITTFFEFQLSMIWIGSYSHSVRKYGLFNIFSLYLVGVFFFSLGAVLHYLVSGDDIRVLEKGIGNFLFPHVVIQEALWAYSVFLFIASMVYDIQKTKSCQYDKLEYKLSFNQHYFRIGKFLMYASLVVVIYKGYLFVISFVDNRELIFLYGNMSNPIPQWLRFLATFFEVGFFFILASNPDERMFKKYSLFFFVSIIPDMLVGNRCMFGGFSLFYVCYYYYHYKKQIMSKMYAVILGLVFLFIFQFMQMMRDNVLGDFSFTPTKFLVGQGFSFFILPLYIVNMNNIEFYHYPFILYNVIGGFSGYSGQSYDMLRHTCGVGHQLMYTVNSDYYLMGGSFGSSNITEMYDLGLIGFVCACFFFAYMLRFLELKMMTKSFWRFLSYSLMISIFISPRGSFFPSFYSVFKYYLFYRLVLFLYSIFFCKSKVYR